MTALLAAHTITVRYDTRSEPVLAGLSLEVRAGEFLGVVGPNGSGKSTLIRALSRALRPAHGAVLLADQDLYAQTSARRSAQRIGVVPQSAAAAFGFTVRDIVGMGRTPHLPRRPFTGETAGDAQIVADALRDAGIEYLAGRIVTTLSGGEWQRVLLARALAQQPDVLLLDEPTAHLDIRHQWETLALVRDLAHSAGKAVLAVLHDLNLAAAYCDRLLLLSGGLVVADGPPERVLTAAHLQQVYGTPVTIQTHPSSGRPFILPPVGTYAERGG